MRWNIFTFIRVRERKAHSRYVVGMNFDIACKEDCKYTFFITVSAFRKLILQSYFHVHAMMRINSMVIISVKGKTGLGRWLSLCSAHWTRIRVWVRYPELIEKWSPVSLRDGDQRFALGGWPAIRAKIWSSKFGERPYLKKNKVESDKEENTDTFAHHTETSRQNIGHFLCQ